MLSYFSVSPSVSCSDWMISIILSSRSLTHSSALFILLFIAFSSAFILANEFSNFSWLLLIIFLSFLSNLSIAFLNSFNIFITSFLKLVSIRLKRSFIVCFFRGILLAF